MDNSRIICLDIETTGLNMYNDDEILQLSIIDGDYKILFNEYIKPGKKQAWPHAEKIHGISPEMVKNKKRLEEHQEEIEKILKDAAIIVGYNHRSFDLPFLDAKGISIPKSKMYCDVMNEFSRRSDTKTRKKLTECASCYGYMNMEELAHDSLEDVKATLFCFQKMVEQDPTFQSFTSDGFEVIRFSSIMDKMDAMRAWKILSPKAKKMKPIFYKDQFLKKEFLCEVIGYVRYSRIVEKENVSFDTVLIEVGKEIKWIHSAYLKQMQEKNFFDLKVDEAEE